MTFYFYYFISIIGLKNLGNVRVYTDDKIKIIVCGKMLTIRDNDDVMYRVPSDRCCTIDLCSRSVSICPKTKKKNPRFYVSIA